MPLGLVLIQDPLHLEVEGAVEGGQAFGQVLMYGGFADAEFPGGGAHCCPVFDDVRRQSTGAFLDISFQNPYTPSPVLPPDIYECKE